MTATQQNPYQGPDLPPYLQVVLDTLNDPKRSTKQSLHALLQVLADRSETILRLKQEINQLNEALEEVQAYLTPRLGTPGPEEETEIAFTI
jgi:ABC-type transporter Mla subunit MlaD